MIESFTNALTKALPGLESRDVEYDGPSPEQIEGVSITLDGFEYDGREFSDYEIRIDPDESSGHAESWYVAVFNDEGDEIGNAPGIATLDACPAEAAAILRS